MKKVTCRNGHFFDADRFAVCPSCGADPVGQVPAPTSNRVEQAPSTQPLTPPAGVDVASPPMPGVEKQPLRSTDHSHDDGSFQPVASPVAGAPAPKNNGYAVSQMKKDELTASVEATASKRTSPLPKTMAYYDVGEVEPPVGWLVCVQGTYIGHAFVCKAGRNRVGRDLGMDICLPEDPSISRDTHAVIVFEPKGRTFYLQAGTGSGLTYHNGNLVFDHEKINPRDTIELGKAKFIFIPLCGAEFTWEDYMTKD